MDDSRFPVRSLTPPQRLGMRSLSRFNSHHRQRYGFGSAGQEMVSLQKSNMHRVLISRATASGTELELFTWGHDLHGQLGSGTVNYMDEPTTVPDISGITDVAVGYEFTLILAGDGTVWAAGRNRDGALGESS